MAALQQHAKAGELLALLPASPDAYPQNLDLVRRMVLVIRMNERAYRDASFLDDRVLGPGTQGAWLSGAAASKAASQVADQHPLHFIFHTGHVGSTLLSRLLDETGAVLPLREPLPLRVLADAHDVLGGPESLLAVPQFEALLEVLLRLWSRGYDRTRAVVVKATSSAGRIAVPVLAARPASRAVYLNLRAEPYLATLLAGASSPVDLRGHGPGRVRRLMARRPVALTPLHALSPGELAALGWLVESLSCQDAMRAHATRVLPVDFEEFMTDMAGHLARVLAHFGLPAGPDDLARVAGSQVLQRYSKAPEQPFTPGEREARLARSRLENREEIARGMAWLDRMARLDGTVALLRAGPVA
jgi:hypothetical protein